ncbi:Bug family tripartite tricarboxylate transporter substrate binding protein [Variovorax sp. PBL-E5]|uniref:Bug family tripartite tricarboxylate transporter substrate binding protein n=1 Tax=Variovorax sp. PBL-E5 TaxID=434014 RepID=UPI001316BD60|nr:tripartite tricarboxylate transporter substrate binding protein [Variovorax sp. PBL-E5]VTU45837.1 Argininosuccinate lyase [Variovorax sp. PBL-E5]
MSNAHNPIRSAPARGPHSARWRRAARRVLAGIAVSWLCMLQASAAPYPAHAVTLISAFPPGGIVDIIARRIAQSLSERLGQPFIVENRTGAAGSIGYAYAARANPDGYTLVLASGPTTMAPPNDSALGWNPLTSFSAIGMIGTIPQAIVASPAVPAHDLREFVPYARQQGDRINYGSPGLGTTPFFTMELLKSQQGLAMTHIAYRGQPDVMVDLMRGDLALTSVTVPLVVANVQKGKMKALAVTSRTRVQALPDVPTVYEQGMPDLGISNWFALLGPDHLPPDVVALLAKSLNDALATQQMQAGLAEIGLITQTASPAETLTFVRSDLSRWIAMMSKVSAAETTSQGKGMK